MCETDLKKPPPKKTQNTNTCWKLKGILKSGGGVLPFCAPRLLLFTPSNYPSPAAQPPLPRLRPHTKIAACGAPVLLTRRVPKGSSRRRVRPPGKPPKREVRALRTRGRTPTFLPARPRLTPEGLRDGGREPGKDGKVSSRVCFSSTYLFIFRGTPHARTPGSPPPAFRAADA